MNAREIAALFISWDGLGAGPHAVMEFFRRGARRIAQRIHNPHLDPTPSERAAAARAGDSLERANRTVESSGGKVFRFERR